MTIQEANCEVEGAPWEPMEERMSRREGSIPVDEDEGH